MTGEELWQEFMGECLDARQPFSNPQTYYAMWLEKQVLSYRNVQNKKETSEV